MSQPLSTADQPSQSATASLAASSRRATLPSWLLSLLFHLAVMVILGLTLRIAPRQGTANERTADVGIVLKHQQDGDVNYEGEEEAGGGDSAAATATGSGTSVADALNDSPAADPSSVLPEAFGAVGASGLPDGDVGNAGKLPGGPRGPGRNLGGKFRTEVFGIEGEGTKIVYVFDRSISMRWRNALETAKRELLASLDSLDKVHQFQIIFYNEEPQIVPTGRVGNALVFGTEQNKTAARRFVGGIVANGSTDHERALVLAIKLQPDVIFFLTDADDPVIGPGQLAKIKRMSTGITIHAVEFGLGPRSQGENFLTRLARDNGGKHGYVDISTFSAPRSF
ncbi:MAG: hypothetical protein HQ567_23790 [Candidatus Nealsonbacteria bacterium]|nr:hypothetical protein [Candidatus Nealsonbacteria bacterium]